MASWSRKRRLIYAIIAIVILVAAVGVPTFLIVYEEPTCFDGIRNGGEEGIDCGGSCAKLCPSAFLPPVVSWVRFKETAPNLYNVAAYIANPNPQAEARGVPYKLIMYGPEALPVAEVYGTATLPARRNVLAFQASVSTTQAPIRAVLEFQATPEWVKADDALAKLRIVNQAYTETPRDSSLLVTIINEDIEPIYDITVYAILKDASGNVVNFSKTLVDSIQAQGSTVAPFTWPVNHGGEVISIEVLTVAEWVNE